MADQTVRVENMPEPATKQDVAFRLWNVLRYELRDKDSPIETINQSLDLYVTCLQATSYHRKTQL